ncbi:MAG TPA: cytochrome b/b6 domain-containing protein [Acetobacteraceae bacterium]|nr:cytochrome b/b6 domain-containing protein [Acetobacteraceae bacterium]
MAAEPARGPGWSRAQRALHWWNAGFVLAAFVIAWVMVGVPLAELLLKFILFQVHKTLGILAFLVVLVRLLLRARRGRPAEDAALPAWQIALAGWAHRALYALLIVTPVLGYLTASLAPLRIPTLFLGVIPLPALTGPSQAWFGIVFALHRALAIALIVLAVGHAAAAIRHHLLGRAVLVRMWRG